MQQGLELLKSSGSFEIQLRKEAVNGFQVASILSLTTGKSINLPYVIEKDDVPAEYQRGEHKLMVQEPAFSSGAGKARMRTGLNWMTREDEYAKPAYFKEFGTKPQSFEASVGNGQIPTALEMMEFFYSFHNAALTAPLDLWLMENK